LKCHINIPAEPQYEVLELCFWLTENYSGEWFYSGMTKLNDDFDGLGSKFNFKYTLTDIDGEILTQLKLTFPLVEIVQE